MLQKNILKTIHKYDLISPLDRVLIGVSGGPDSLALLYLLNDLKVKLGISIIVAHLNHGIRGRASDSDERFVRDTADKLGLDFISRKIDWRPRHKHPSEEALRKLRYDFLSDAAKKYRINKIALAHNLDDQAETVLMRLIRGTGLYGLISILPKRRVGSFFIIRPLLEASRLDIERYLRKIRAKARVDKTNLEDNFLRNKIRHGILKELEKINPNIKGTLARFSQQAVIDYDYLRENAKQFLKSGSGSAVKIDLRKFNSSHMALQRMALRLILEGMAGDLRTFTNKHWEEIQDLAANRPLGSIVHLTKEILARKGKGYLLISSRKHKIKP
ncbi:MAG: tRNA lysidine(34) synthetase TilS [Candidatus Omnitrophica bacterium]|nr:tRNA lysidine(34) synthetase TilS [Candidatus Omnitrophota bacterium]MDD5355310.1 tRNA lysidine(34) synthetase TilS [Candidatus Omnitrophota bacterium]